jgi:hypothetical protein
VAVDVPGDSDTRMAELLRHDLREHAGAEGDRRPGVPEPVKDQAGECRARDRAPERPSHVRGTQRRAELIGEDESRVDPERAGREPLGRLPLPQVAQHGNRFHR